MKAKFIYIILSLAFFFSLNLSVSYSQNITITDDNTYIPASSAILDIKSNTKGLLIPRLTTSERKGLVTPVKGLLVFDSEETLFYYFDGTAWVKLSIGLNLWSQNGSSVLLSGSATNVGFGTVAPDNSAILDLSSSSKGFLVPRMAGSQRIAISSPSKGLMVYDTDDNSFYYFDGSSWNKFSSGTNLWLANGGNAILNNAQNIGIGTSSPENSAILDVKSATKGVLIPRMTSIQRNAISNPVKGLMVFDTDVNNFFYYNGNLWTAFISGLQAWSINSSTIYTTNSTNKIGIGTSSSAGKFTIQGDATANPGDPLFEVKNNNNQTVFAVYPDGVQVYVTPGAKGSQGGFSVGRVGTGKSTYEEYFRVTPDSTRVFVKQGLKGTSGGFSVGRVGTGKSPYEEYLRVTTDSTTIYVKESQKGSQGGFSVGRVGTGKSGQSEYFKVSGNATPDIVKDQARLLWYPSKEAFLVGRVQVLDPADVGLNSFSSGYHSKANGNYSMALGYNSTSSGLNAISIGQTCTASGPYSFAFGSNSQATNTNNVAIGSYARATGTSNNYAFGNNALASGSSDNYAIGSNTSILSGFNSYAIGNNAKVWISSGANAWGSYAIGDHAECYGQRAYAIGSYARALNNDAIAFGTNTKSTGYTSIAIGANGTNADTTFATGQMSIALGYAARSTGEAALAFGSNANSSGAGSIALGRNSIANASGSLALGSYATATGNYSIAIGNSASTNDHSGSIVIADGNGNLQASDDNQITIRASGGYKFFTNANLLIGVQLKAGEGSWSLASDYRKKANFENINMEVTLNKLADINIQSWNYKAQSPDIRHIGITAQDFYNAFKYGDCDTTISEIDLAGINMVAIQGLIKRNEYLKNQVFQLDEKVRKLEVDISALLSDSTKINALIQENKDLKVEIEQIKTMIKQNAVK
jgi:trimeric autotransporter adhesin